VTSGAQRAGINCKVDGEWLFELRMVEALRLVVDWVYGGLVDSDPRFRCTADEEVGTEFVRARVACIGGSGGRCADEPTELETSSG
jgi:hypothetical protein